MLEAIAADDSGPAAMKVEPELQDLRNACDRMDIKWHWRHKGSSLLKMIKDAEKADHPMITVEATVDANAVTVNSTPRQIPPDVKAALEYMYSYKRANAKLVEAFIESLL